MRVYNVLSRVYYLYQQYQLPKEKSTKAYCSRNFVLDFGESVFSTDNCILSC